MRATPNKISDTELRMERDQLRAENRDLSSKVAFWRAKYEELSCSIKSWRDSLAEKQGKLELAEEMRRDAVEARDSYMTKVITLEGALKEQREVVQSFFQIMKNCGCSNAECCARGVGAEILDAMNADKL